MSAENQIKTTIDKIFLETVEDNINLFVYCCIFLLSLLKLSINKKMEPAAVHQI